VFFVTSQHGRILLRIYGVGVDEILHRDREIVWLKLLSQMNIGPQLLGTFANGRLEQYLDSATLTHPEISDPVVSETIANRIGELHSIVDTFPPTKIERDSPEIWYNVDKWYPMAMHVVTEIYKRKPESREGLRLFGILQLDTEIKNLKEILNKLDSEIVFCHNDVGLCSLTKLCIVS
jgi:choline/ethanolamine kinase